MNSELYSVPSAKAALQFLDKVKSSIRNTVLRHRCRSVLYDPRFQVAPGSHEKHHAYKYGLLIHTAEVTALALQSAASFPVVDFDVLATAAIFHDFNKIFDYTMDETGKIEKTRYRVLVRHLAGSHATFVASIAKVESDFLPRETVMLIEHAILAHHGRKEWGSPVEPDTIEAHLLHNADFLSYKFGAKTINDMPIGIS